MKKVLNYASLFLVGAVVALSSCKKTDDPTPDANPNAKVFETKMYATNFGSTGEAIVVGTVSTSDGTVKLRLNINHSGTNNVSKIFIMQSTDNGAFAPMSYSGNITNSYGTFSGSSSAYTFDVSSGLKSFILDIPVPVRSSALPTATDVYQIWITDGAGAFNKPGKNRVLGPATITLGYSATASSTSFATSTVDLGTQSAVPASFLVTSGQISVLNTADYNDSPNSADIRLTTMTGGQKDNGSTAVWLYSPASVPTGATADGSAVFTVPTGSNTTYLAAYSGSTTFDNVTASTLSGLSVGTGTSVQISAGNVYMFKTAGNPSKTGLIKINSLTAETDTDKGYSANVTVKVLN